VTDVFVFDATALLALFRSHGPIFHLFMRADTEPYRLVFPAAAIADANTYLQGSEDEWRSILMGRVDCLPLTEHIAITVGTWPGDLATRHVVYVRGDIVTREPNRYQPWTVSTLEL
jgi:hypothetical protein